MKTLGRIGALFLLVLVAATIVSLLVPVDVDPRHIFLIAMIGFAAYVAIDHLRPKRGKRDADDRKA